MRLFALKSNIDLCGCEAFFQRTESDWSKLLFALFSVPFATQTGDLSST